MGFLSLTTAALALAAPVFGHPGHKEAMPAHRAVPLEQRSLSHCGKAFNHPEFMKRTLERLGPEFSQLRRNLGFETEEEYG